MLFKDKLKKYRVENNISQEELSSKLYVSRTLISKWENGVVYPSASNMEKLAELMQVDINYLLSNEETKSLTLNANSKQEISFTKKVIYIISLILLTVVITLLIVGYIFPQDLTRPSDVYNSVNTITVICFILKTFGGIFCIFGIIVSTINYFMTIKSK